MELKDFLDFKLLQDLQNQFSDATGLAAVILDNKGNYITEGSNFTDFCTRYTRASREGQRRCEKCFNESTGTYRCHAGLMDFSCDIVVEGEKLGTVIGGQVLPEEPDEEKFAGIARELGIGEREYVAAVKRVPVRPEKAICAEKIASKQNILALNASIEAGRAGALGAGFAVVASQMGDLSKQSGVIYKDIQQLASDIYTSVQKMNESR